MHLEFLLFQNNCLYILILYILGEKPYWCIACKARFSQLHPLKQHVINKHGGNSDLIRMDKKEGRTRYINHWSSQDQVQDEQECFTA